MKADNDPGAAPMSEIDRELFLGVMASFPAGVAVVTAVDRTGAPRGLTLSAFCSVSLDPPLILVCVDRGSSTLEAIEHSGKFTVNFLSEGREQIARTFATKLEGKFAAQAWRHPETLAGGGPVLHEDSVAHAACTVYDAVEAGDHRVFIGRVVEAHVDEGTPRSLLFHRRSFSASG